MKTPLIAFAMITLLGASAGLAFGAYPGKVEPTEAVVGFTPRPIQMAQTYSPRCVTPVAVCTTATMPVGTPCVCGSSTGTIAP